MKDEAVAYWAHNLPLQVMPVHQDPDDEESPVTGHLVLNYQPRRERIGWVPLEEVLYGLTKEQYFALAALVLNNLAKLMNEVMEAKRDCVYYADEGLTFNPK